MRDGSHHSSQHYSVLLVQYQVSVARALSRNLTQFYRDVHLAVTPDEAELLLEKRSSQLHLVCGQYFGLGRPLGQNLIATWRERYPEIRRAVLATGAELDSEQLEGVDGVYHKPAPIFLLLNLLGVRNHDLFVAHPSSNQPHGDQHESKIYPSTSNHHPQGASQPGSQAG